MARYRDRRLKLVCGVGFNDLLDEPVYTEGEIDYTYQLWKSMIVRCYSNRQLSKNPTYKKCKVSEDFLIYSKFKHFIENLHGYDLRDSCGRRYQLDKDILGDGNVYSRETVCLVPQEINKFLTTSDAARGDYPIGVCLDKRTGRFQANLRFSGKTYYLGSYSNPLDAFKAYKIAKESKAKVLAGKWKDLIDIRVYDKLMTYKVKDDIGGTCELL